MNKFQIVWISEGKKDKLESQLNKLFVGRKR